MYKNMLHASTKSACIITPLPMSGSTGWKLLSCLLFMSSFKKRGRKQIYIPLSWPLYRGTACLLCTYLLVSHWLKLFELQANAKSLTTFLLFRVGSITILIGAVTIAAVVITRLKYAQQRKALEQIIDMYHQSRQSLVRYVMLNRQCSEETAYQHIKAFVKKHTSFDEHCSIDRIFVQDRQSLLDRALSILVHFPGEIDTI